MTYPGTICIIFKEHYDSGVGQTLLKFPKTTDCIQSSHQISYFLLPLSHSLQILIMAQKCRGKGSCAPGAVPNGKIRIYSMRFCPYAQRTRLVLSAKGIEPETINIDLKNKPEWYLEKNPLGQVPILETPSGQIICESAITCEYLDEVYPEKKLYPTDPFAKAQQKMLLEDYSKVIPLFYKIPMTRMKGEDVSALEAELKEKLCKLNKVLVNRKSKYFGGNSVTMIDYLIWPWFERVEAWQLKQCLDGLAELNNWILLMKEDPAVKALMFSIDDHKVFLPHSSKENPIMTMAYKK